MGFPSDTRTIHPAANRFQSRNAARRPMPPRRYRRSTKNSATSKASISTDVGTRAWRTRIRQPGCRCESGTGTGAPARTNRAEGSGNRNVRRVPTPNQTYRSNRSYTVPRGSTTKRHHEATRGRVLLPGAQPLTLAVVSGGASTQPFMGLPCRHRSAGCNPSSLLGRRRTISRAGKPSSFAKAWYALPER